MVSHKKCIAMLRRSCAVAGCTAIPVTCKIEAAVSRRAGAIIVSVFFLEVRVCCGCGLLGDDSTFVLLWCCDLPLVSHMDLNQIYHTKDLVWLIRLQLFSFKIISTYVGFGIEIRLQFFHSIWVSILFCSCVVWRVDIKSCSEFIFHTRKMI